MNYDKRELTPSLRSQLTPGTLTIGACNALCEEREAMKIAPVNEENSIKV